MESKLIEELLSVMVEYVSIVYQAVLLKIIVHHQLSPQFAITICDSRSTIMVQDVPAAAVLDLQTIKHTDSREEI